MADPIEVSEVLGNPPALNLEDLAERSAASGNLVDPVLPDDKPTGSQCRVCRGAIVESFKREKLIPMHIGTHPGYIVHKDYHCKDCGLVYAFPPPSDGYVKPF